MFAAKKNYYIDSNLRRRAAAAISSNSLPWLFMLDSWALNTIPGKVTPTEQDVELSDSASAYFTFTGSLVTEVLEKEVMREEGQVDWQKKHRVAMRR